MNSSVSSLVSSGSSTASSGGSIAVPIIVFGGFIVLFVVIGVVAYIAKFKQMAKMSGEVKEAIDKAKVENQKVQK